ncbi:hypothetical protein JQX08_17980 [Pseudomonas sp. UL073]|uniref:Transmembrane protein n=1 Tax=Zestomonas insulae TaxID=2809017 RepID=A0ABS2IHR4_9GAMM|nr:hypothetical protein [Pseudomonas insulae]MBM7062607.1 hypothetical protein [Pseudomonas insulae]
MDVTMNPTSTPEQRPHSRRRGRWQLILLLMVALGPMLLATAMYKWRFWVPDSRNYHGVLVGGSENRAALGVDAGDEARWQLLVTAPEGCAKACQELVYLARQINIGLARDATRASHALASSETLPVDFAELIERDYPQLQRYSLDRQQYDSGDAADSAAHLWIVDPHGNLVLRYDSGVNGKDVLIDLRLLLKLSNIG